MSKFSQFFPKGSTGSPTLETLDSNYLFCRTPGNKTNRQIFYGPSSQTWTVPETTTEVEVHVWGGGGGGNGTCASGGGGGGGYARTRYKVSSTDTLSIIVGGNAGTSSVTIPTQSPISPVSATGGSNASPTCTAPPSPGGCCGWTGGAGGSGTVSLGPIHPRSYCFTASGGRGTSGYEGPTDTSCNIYLGGGGGAAGSPFGPGGPGGITDTASSCVVSSGSGGGIGGCNGIDSCHILNQIAPSPGIICAMAGGGGGSMGNAFFGCYQCPTPVSSCTIMLGGGIGRDVNSYVNTTQPTDRIEIYYQCSNSKNNEWFAIEQIQGAGGFGAVSYSQILQPVNGGAGAGGGGGIIATCSPSANLFIGQMGVGGDGGFLGGGSGLIYSCVGGVARESNRAGSGGCAGGSGGGAPGTPGVVIIYW